MSVCAYEDCMAAYKFAKLKRLFAQRKEEENEAFSMKMNGDSIGNRTLVCKYGMRQAREIVS